MKKSLLTTSMVVLAILFSQGQEIDRYLIAVAGDRQESAQSNFSLQWAVGETKINTYQQSTHLVEGFQQGKLILKPKAHELEKLLPPNNYSIECYPNPTLDFLRLRLSSESIHSNQKYRLNIIDPSGKICFNTEIKAQELVSLDVVNTFTAGHYRVNVYSNDNLLISRNFIKL